jgi:hypothetical protein
LHWEHILAFTGAAWHDEQILVVGGTDGCSMGQIILELCVLSNNS